MNALLKPKYLFAYLLAISLVSCGSNSSTSSLTGWSLNDPKSGGFELNQNYRGQETPPGMVLIDGGTFTMGKVQDDVMYDWNTAPVKMQVRSFYLDEAEVTNLEYVFYLQWLEKVFPPSDENFKHIYQSALPDTLVWRNALGNNELLTENYLRHPAYANYPVVGVSWLQANAYCKWRTNVVNEKILVDKGVLKPLWDQDSLEVYGKNNFDTDVYLANPNMMFDGNGDIYDRGLKDLSNPNKEVEKGDFTGRQVKMEDGILMPKFRLPTEAEWEYAAKADVENREYNNLRGRKKYPWNGKYTRNKSKKDRGKQLANFKQGQGDYSGLAGWSNDGAEITTSIKSYPPNGFGLYDMAGNVAEWVADVYRPIIDSEQNDLNYYRGNEFTKKYINDDGTVSIYDSNNIEFDTLQNGKILPKNLPGSLKYVDVTNKDAFMRYNYSQSYNVDARDGDVSSTRNFTLDEEESLVAPRMYNHPTKGSSYTDEDGNVVMTYDDEFRTTLISDETRVFKGGSWKDRAYWLDPAQRKYFPQFMATEYIGFRCATDRFGENKKVRSPIHRLPN
ncbi:gliding motility lipoprotein GldJ [Flavobacteriaceae bacterium]|nr:gliding motility lipoprotein GldJ [Flavobacteriaceae bacterium]